MSNFFTLNLMLCQGKTGFLKWALAMVWNLFYRAISPFFARGFHTASRAKFFPAQVTRVLALTMVLGCCVFSANPAHAKGKVLFHATSKAIAQKIRIQGINPAKFRSGTRFGRGFYLCRKAPAAISEKGKSSEVLAFKESRYIRNNSIDMRKPSANKIRSFLGDIDLRGKIKKWIIGPKLGEKLGKKAAQKGQVIQYRSVKTGETNVFIPQKVYEQHPGIVQPKKIGR